jgi:uncharacterized protein
MMADSYGGGFLHRASGEHGIALTHGAGTNCNAALLQSLAALLAEGGVTILRYDLPFRVSRPAGPPRSPDAAADRDGIRAAVQAVRCVVPGRVVAGGHSYGGRQTSIAAAENLESADGLVLLSYPLHPPRRASELRTGHFPQIHKPCLFIHGTRDPFGSPAEMTESLKMIPGPVELYVIDGAGHDLNRPARTVQSVAARIIEWVATLQ